ncbi:hypothetical protein [Stieleria maiorica]|uniref:hypothetical protein n=1 Tax=Stieleria maiorica TaxID=2795974 RepID=UPI0011CC471E|nr:hypothetical protein [Stieleria maiorica]
MNVFASKQKNVRRPSLTKTPAPVARINCIPSDIADAPQTLAPRDRMKQRLLEILEIPVGNFFAMCDI